MARDFIRNRKTLIKKTMIITLMMIMLIRTRITTTTGKVTMNIITI